MKGGATFDLIKKILKFVCFLNAFKGGFPKNYFKSSGHPVLAKLGPGGTDSPRCCMGRDCLWDSEEQEVFSGARLKNFSTLYLTDLDKKS